MTKKQFIALADMIRQHNINTQAEGGFEIFERSAIEALANFCQSQNPRFDRQRWLDYIYGKAVA